MEQTDSRKCHRHVVLVAALDNSIVTNRSARLCDVLDAALVCALNVVAEREEGIGTYGYALHLIEPCTFFFSCEDFRFYFEDLLPCAVCEDIHVLVADVNVDRIVTVCAADAVYELQIQHLRALTQEPVVGFLSGKAGAVYTGLLACTDTDRLAVFDEAYGVRLGIF